MQPGGADFGRGARETLWLTTVGLTTPGLLCKGRPNCGVYSAENRFEIAMNHSFEDRLRNVPAATARLARELFRDLAPKVLFFFSAFILIFLLFKLFVEQYSIEFSAFTKAAVGALILGKVIPLLDWAQSGHRFETHRRVVVIACKTLVYALVVIVLGIGERIFEASRKQRSWNGGVHFVIANANIDRFLGLVLLISLVVGTYLTLQEIDRAMGKGALFRLLFERPLDTKA